MEDIGLQSSPYAPSLIASSFIVVVPPRPAKEGNLHGADLLCRLAAEKESRAEGEWESNKLKPNQRQIEGKSRNRSHNGERASGGAHGTHHRRAAVEEHQHHHQPRTGAARTTAATTEMEACSPLPPRPPPPTRLPILAAAPASPRPLHPKLGRRPTSCSGSPRASSGSSTSIFACCGISLRSARIAQLATTPSDLHLLFKLIHLASRATAASAERAGSRSPVLLDPWMRRPEHRGREMEMANGEWITSPEERDA
nr:unnamed protein product [Digitaria exilis]